MRVTVGMPTLGHVDIRIAALLYRLIRESKHEISVIHTPRADICQARNAIIKSFLEKTDDYLLFLDDDNPPEDPDFLDKLLEAAETGKPIVSALVPSRQPDDVNGKHRLCIFTESFKPNGDHRYDPCWTVPEGTEVMEIANCGFGCVLLKREVLEAMQGGYSHPCEMRMVTYYKDFEDKEWTRDERTDVTKATDKTKTFKRYMSEDLLFFDRARYMGFPIYAHKGVKCGHIGINKLITIKHHIEPNSCAK